MNKAYSVDESGKDSFQQAFKQILSSVALRARDETPRILILQFVHKILVFRGEELCFSRGKVLSATTWRPLFYDQFNW
jgi:hypothetical protein